MSETGEHYPGTYAASDPDRPAVIMHPSGEVVTYAQLDADANRLARVLREHGLQPGDHVAILVENHPRFLSMAWGAHYAGLYYTAISTRLTAEEAAYIVDDCGARALITSAAKGDLAAAILDDTPKVELRLAVDGDVPGHQRYEEVVAASTMVVVDRPGIQVELPAGIDWIRVESPRLEVSSTDLRARFTDGRPLDYLVTDEVLDLIRAEGYYADVAARDRAVGEPA